MSAARLILPALCLTYLLAPGHPLSLLRGVPLDYVGLILFAGLGIALYGLGFPRNGRWTAILAVVGVSLVFAKLALWSSAPDYGLAASYYSRNRIGGPPERSTVFRAAAFTRLDAQPGQTSFPRYFFNDVERFNFYEAGQPDRQALPFAVRWDGYLHAPASASYPFALSANGTAALWVDEQPLLTVSARAAEQEDRATLALSAGAHPIRIEYVDASGAPPSLSLEWDPGGGPRPIAAPSVTVEPVDEGRLARDGVVGRVAPLLDSVFLIGLLVMLSNTVARGLVPRRLLCGGQAPALRATLAPTEGAERPLLALFLAAVLFHALLTTQDLYRQTVILEGGQDWLTYESYARDILLDGPLMTLGKPLGQGKPFFFQPFYPYYLAALHWLTGEDLWGPVALQLLGLGVCGVILFWLARRLYGAGAAWLGLGLFAILCATQLDWVARKLLSENLYFLLLPAAVLLLVRFVDERRRRDLALGGLLLGLASITRAPTLLYAPGAALVVAVAVRRSGAGMRSALGQAIGLLVLVGAVAALVPLRNYFVSGHPVLMATNAGATLLIAHTPGLGVRLGRVDENRLYNALSLDRPTREVLEFVRQDPIGYAGTLLPLGLYTLGFAGAIDGSSSVAPDILALSALYLSALFVLPGSRTLRAAPLHLFVATHFLVMIAFVPYFYGYRQVLPMQLMMLVFAAALLANVLGRAIPICRLSPVAEPPRPPAGAAPAQQRPG